jgi:hypothetical protein
MDDAQTCDQFYCQVMSETWRILRLDIGLNVSMGPDGHDDAIKSQVSTSGWDAVSGDTSKGSQTQYGGQNADTSAGRQVTVDRPFSSCKLSLFFVLSTFC